MVRVAKLARSRLHKRATNHHHIRPAQYYLRWLLLFTTAMLRALFNKLLASLKRWFRRIVNSPDTMTKKKVVILGGGVAGMSAAHMLAQRNFEVIVFDRNKEYVGGKARSVNVPGTNVPSGYDYLPGEHGFRFFPGFYEHVTDTMKQIPLGNGKTAYDNLTDTETVQIQQKDEPPITVPLHFPSSLKDVVEIFAAFVEASEELTMAEAEYFAERIWQLMTSCEDRYLNEYESVAWWEFTAADNFSQAYRDLLVNGLTRSLVAAKAQVASTRTVGTVFLQLLYTMIDPGNTNTDRVLNSPTNDAWLDPWYKYLTDTLGVRYYKGHELTKVNMTSARDFAPVASVQIQDLINNTPLPPITADYYLMAVPVEVASEVIQASPPMLQADAALQNIITLAPNVEWMNGIQFYLTEEFDMHRGHTIYANSNWALTSISQIQFWPDYSLAHRYAGRAKGILSVDISSWDTPGNFNKKKAENCTRQEVIDEVWKQLTQEINSEGQKLTPEMLVFVYLDMDIYQPTGVKCAVEADALPLAKPDDTPVSKLKNKEPLLVNLINSWTLRPNAFTNIPNLFLASDYVKTYTDLATMEGANEAARRATNNILDASDSSAAKCELWKLKTPIELEALRLLDQKRWNEGLSWQNPI